MTLTVRNATNRLRTATRRLQHLTAQLPAAISDIHHASTDTNNQRDIDSVRRHGWITDPTGETATNQAFTIEDQLDDVTQQLDTLALTLTLLTRFADGHQPAPPPINSEKRQCGTHSPREVRTHDWYTTPNRLGRTPDQCHDEADGTVRADGSINWHPLGLCPTHRRRWQNLNRQ